MRVWRLCAPRHAAVAFAGEGAKKAGGRWNPRGRAAVYTSGTLALAALEMLAHVDRDTAPELVAVPADIPDGQPLTVVDSAGLPAGWRAYPAPPELQRVGAEWLAAGRTAVLVVPSVIVPVESNYVLNPLHADFARIVVGRPIPFLLDPRLTRA